jgi:hypothetical protein
MKKTVLLLVVLITIFVPSLALAKGDFAYITVSGQGLQGELTLTTDTFVRDFFAFADFSKDRIDPPLDYDPDFAFEITRFYLEDTKPYPFDRLIYYPDQGYVYYVGLAEGTSEYDGQWFNANPAIEAPFRAALAERARLSWIPLGVFVVLLAIFILAYTRANPKS